MGGNGKDGNKKIIQFPNKGIVNPAGQSINAGQKKTLTLSKGVSADGKTNVFKVVLLVDGKPGWELESPDLIVQPEIQAQMLHQVAIQLGTMPKLIQELQEAKARIIDLEKKLTTPDAKVEADIPVLSTEEENAVVDEVKKEGETNTEGGKKSE